ncbi:MAG: hypothetical protein JO193_08880 [Candidatus Eremiobacteraeota bacterium]|nr:hypothetical protein [Candidatus Eremiobacteraeota bacterium]
MRARNERYCKATATTVVSGEPSVSSKPALRAKYAVPNAAGTVTVSLIDYR